VVAMQKGMANHTRPPIRKPGTEAEGLAATCMCVFMRVSVCVCVCVPNKPNEPNKPKELK
jgi:hypothetical protein